MKTYLDAGVLILGFRSEDPASECAIQILNDPEREFAASVFVQLETMPKAQYHRQNNEADFYETYFSQVSHWARDVDFIIQEASLIASQYGLSAMDALHVAAALSVGAEELITTERLTKPMHRVMDVRVVSLLDDLLEAGEEEVV